jgi:hypothetical protein
MVDPIIAALPLPGLVANLLCDDNSLVLSNPKGNVTVIRARPLSVQQVFSVNASPDPIVRTLDTAFFNPSTTQLMQITATVVIIQGGAPNPAASTLTYETTAGGVSLNEVVGYILTGSPVPVPEIGVTITFYVDPGQTYSINTHPTDPADQFNIVSWVELILQ